MKSMLLVLFIVIFLTSGCTHFPDQHQPGLLGAGFRHSVYGPPYDPGPSYWAAVGESMASRFINSRPQAIWIVGHSVGTGIRFTFPGKSENTNITFSPTDQNEEALGVFDRRRILVWLQVEPGFAPVEELIHIVLKRYGHHPCVIGVGVDAEWYRSGTVPGKQPVSDEDAMAWVKAVRSHDPKYRVFLKHWDREMMPPHYRDGILFVNDGQKFDSVDSLTAHFIAWGKAFAPAPVAFQYGYPADQPWWGAMKDPAGEIGWRILARVPNTGGLFWVDFSVLDVFPAPSE